MAKRRDYGPIPNGVFGDERWLELPWDSRSLLLALFGICSYRGRFSGNPRIIQHEIFADSAERVGVLLAELVEAGWVELWSAIGHSGRTVSVGSIIGYHDLQGLPRDRRNKMPEHPEYPDNPAACTNSPPTPHQLPGDSPPGKAREGKVSKGEERGAPPARVATPVPDTTPIPAPSLADLPIERRAVIAPWCEAVADAQGERWTTEKVWAAIGRDVAGLVDAAPEKWLAALTFMRQRRPQLLAKPMHQMVTVIGWAARDAKGEAYAEKVRAKDKAKDQPSGPRWMHGGWPDGELHDEPYDPATHGHLFGMEAP